MKFSLAQVAKDVTNEVEAYQWLEGLRWPDGEQICPHCNYKGHAYYIKPLNGTTRGTGVKKADGSRTQSYRRLWKCPACRKQFSVLTGTVFHGTKIPIHTWVMVLVEACTDKNGIAAREVERKYGLTAETAWYMLHRIREAMRRDPLVGMMRGTIVSDETYYGGKIKNMHANKPQEPRRIKHGDERAPHGANKTAVLSLVNTTTGEVRSRVVPNVDGHTLRKVIAEQVDMANSVLNTDEGSHYGQLGQEFAAHRTVTHSAGEYVRGSVSTNAIESYFGQLKRSIDGTHHRVSRTHLPRYLDQFDFLATTHKMTDEQRLAVLMGQTGGRRLSYKPLTER